MDGDDDHDDEHDATSILPQTPPEVRYLNPQNIPKTPNPQEVFGPIGSCILEI